MAAEFKMTMKLLVDTKANRVLFAEASKDCVDFLFHMLSLPIATVISLLREDGMVGAVENLYQSIENFHDSYILENHTRDSLLKPNFKSCECSVPMLQQLKYVEPQNQEKLLYMCSQYCTSRVTVDPDTVCPDPECGGKMSSVVTFMDPVSANKENLGGIKDGFVKGVVTYMVMDDLVVQPMSTISCITLLSKFNVADVSVLQEKTVTLGFNEAVKLLKVSLHSKKVLSQVFLNKADPKVTGELVESSNGNGGGNGNGDGGCCCEV